MRSPILLDDAAPLRLHLPPGVSGRLILPLLRSATGHSGPWWVGGRKLEELISGEGPWSGETPITAEPVGAAGADAGGVGLVLETVEGPACGQRLGLGRGRYTVGKSGADLVVPDPALHPVEAALSVDEWGLRLEHRDGALERLRVGEIFELGGSEFQVTSQEHASSNVPGCGHPIPPKMESVPRTAGVATLLISTLLPLMAGLLIAWLLHTWMFLVFAGVGALMALGHHLTRGGSGAKRQRVRRRVVAEEAASVAEAVPPLGRLLSGLPDRPVPADEATGFGVAGVGSTGLVSSGQEADPRLWIDWGVGERFAQVESGGGSDAVPPRLTEARILTHLGVPHALPTDPRLVDALIARLCLRGVPVRLEIAEGARGSGWTVGRWGDSAVPDGSGVAVVSAARRLYESSLRRWRGSGLVHPAALGSDGRPDASRASGSPAGSGADGGGRAAASSGAGAVRVLFTDAIGVGRALAEHAHTGTPLVLVISDQQTHAGEGPRGCLRFEPTRAGFRIHPPSPGTAGGLGGPWGLGSSTPELLWGFGDPTEPQILLRPSAPSEQAAARICRALRAAQDGAGGGASPDRFSAREDLALEECARRWRLTRRDPRTILEIGRCPETGRPVRCDLAEEGPHALVAGTTGAGKSEFLRSLLLSLGLRYGPERLGMVLIDFKGGAGFGPVASLPHVHRLITDLAEQEVHRDLAFLRAEITRRERILHRAGVPSWGEYLVLPESAERPPLPELIICVDEFRMLVDTFPDAMNELMRIATVGRSLGLRLLLCTQRPQGAISPDIRANVSLTVCLRVADEAESISIIGGPQAASLSPTMPGRGFVSTSSGLVPFQAPLCDALPHREAEVPTIRDASGRILARWGAVGAAEGSEGARQGGLGAAEPGREMTRALADLRSVAETPARPVIPTALGTGSDDAAAALASSTPGTLPGDADTSMPGASAGALPLGVAEQPREGRQGPLLWHPEDHGPLGLIGAPAEQARRLLQLAITAAAHGHPIYLCSPDPALVESVTEAVGPALHGVIDPADPAMIPESLRVLMEHGGHSTGAGAGQGGAGSDATGPEPAEICPSSSSSPARPLVLVHRVDRLGEELLRQGIELEEQLERFCAVHGRRWWIVLGSGRSLPRALAGACPNRWWAGSSAREEFEMTHPREARDLLPSLEILTGEVAGSRIPAGLFPSPAGRSEERHEPLSRVQRLRASRERERWPRIRPLPQRLLLEDCPDLMPDADPQTSGAHSSPAEPSNHGQPEKTDAAAASRGTLEVTLGVSAPQGEPAVLPVERGGMTVVLGQAGSGRTQLIRALQALNPHLEFVAVTPDRLTGAAPATPGGTIPGRAVAEKIVPEKIWPQKIMPGRIAVIDQAEALTPDPQLPQRLRALGAEACILLAQTPRFSAAHGPWAAALRRAPGVVVLGQPTGTELDFRGQNLPVGRQPLPPGRGVIVEFGIRTRVQIPLVGAAPRSGGDAEPAR